MVDPTLAEALRVISEFLIALDNRFRGDEVRKRKKIIAIVIQVVIIASLGLWIYLNYHYAYTRPRIPQPDMGRIYPLHVHRTTIYLTQQEDVQLNCLFWTAVTSAAIQMLYIYFYNPFNQDK